MISFCLVFRKGVVGNWICFLCGVEREEKYPPMWIGWKQVVLTTGNSFDGVCYIGSNDCFVRVLAVQSLIPTWEKRLYKNIVYYRFKILFKLIPSYAGGLNRSLLLCHYRLIVQKPRN